MPTEESLREASEILGPGLQSAAARNRVATLLDEHKALRAARDRMAEKDGLRTREHNILVKENRDLRRQLAEAHEAIRAHMDAAAENDGERWIETLDALRAALPAREGE